MRLHHGLYEVHLPVTDVDRAIDFYVGKLAKKAERIFRKMDHADSVINAAPERQPYRNESVAAKLAAEYGFADVDRKQPRPLTLADV